MHENNFEKQVREKMDQLGFDPSDAVWAGVDKELKKDKKRRRPLFWLFLLSGLVLAGGTYYFSTNNNNSKQPEIKNNAVNPEATRDKKPESDVEPNTMAGNSKSETGQKPGQAPLVNKTPDENPNAGKKEINRPVPIISGKEEKQSETNTTKESGTSTDSPANKKAALAAEKTIPKDSAVTGNRAKKKEDKKKPSPWKYGITGAAGLSNANQDLFKPLYSSAQVNYSTANPSPPPTGSANFAPSAVEAGFSFSLGGFVNRSFSKRISVSAGLGYHYYSTKTHTGNYVGTPTYFYPASGALDMTNSYYSNGKDHAYTNKYHFIELPVTIELKLNKSDRMPIIWEAGVSLSYLLSSDALSYDPASNIYYNSSHYMNKVQVNGITAIMVGLPVCKSSLLLGPQLQYGFTGLLKSSNGNPGHMIFYGFKISYIPGKK